MRLVVTSMSAHARVRRRRPASPSARSFASKERLILPPGISERGRRVSTRPTTRKPRSHAFPRAQYTVAATRTQTGDCWCGQGRTECRATNRIRRTRHASSRKSGRDEPALRHARREPSSTRTLLPPARRQRGGFSPMARGSGSKRHVRMWLNHQLSSLRKLHRIVKH